MLVCVVFWLFSDLLADSRDVGFAATVVSVAGLLSGFLNLGLSFAALREIPERDSRGLSAALLIALFSSFWGSPCFSLFWSLWGFLRLYRCFSFPCFSSSPVSCCFYEG